MIRLDSPSASVRSPSSDGWDVESLGETFRIRPIREEDLPALEWDGLYTTFRRMFRQAFDEMRAGQRFLLVLLAPGGEDIIGQAFLQFTSSDFRFADGRRRGYLYALRVKPAYRNRGLGTHLIRIAEEVLRARGMRCVSIGVGKDNPQAMALYQRLGYRILGDVPGEWTYVDHNGELREVVEPAWLLEKAI